MTGFVEYCTHQRNEHESIVEEESTKDLELDHESRKNNDGRYGQETPEGADERRPMVGIYTVNGR